MALTVLDAVALTPPDVAVAAWQGDFAAAWAAPRRDHYAGIAELMFAEADCDPRAIGGTTAATNVPVAAGRTQLDLACEVTARLLDRSPDARARCRLVVYLAASLDEDVYASTVGKLTAALDLHGALHFSVGQVGSAALAGALDIVDAMLADAPGACALIVAAERWPLPLPRLVDGVTALADGAAALLVATDGAGLRVVATANGVGPSFLAGGDGRAALAAAVAAEVAGLAARHGVAAGDLVWLPSDLGAALDAAVVAAAGGVAAGPAADVNRMTAAVASHLADLVDRPGGTAALGRRTLVGWGAAYAGGIGVTLFQSHGRTVH